MSAVDRSVVQDINTVGMLWLSDGNEATGD